MKKLFSILIISFLCTNSCVFAEEIKEVQSINPPVWEDYVPEKYQNPKDFPKGKSIAELSVGIALTDLIITAPIGVPMIVHSTTKLKNKSYYDKKIKFEKGLAEAENISNPSEKEAYYAKLLKDCDMKAEDKVKLEKKRTKKHKQVEVEEKV